MATFEQWPDSLQSATLLFHLQPNVRFGPLLPDDRQQRVRASTGHWIAETTFTVALTAEHQLYAALATKASGGTTEFFVPNRVARQTAPWPTGYTPDSGQIVVAIAGGGSLANSAQFVTRVIDVRAHVAAVAGATTMRIKRVRSGTLTRGQYFTVTDSTGRKRMHQLTERPRIAGTDGGYTLYDVQFLPALRGPVKVGTQCDFENPSCTMIFAAPNTGQAVVRPFMIAEPSISWRESFNGL